MNYYVFHPVSSPTRFQKCGTGWGKVEQRQETAWLRALEVSGFILKEFE